MGMFRFLYIYTVECFAFLFFYLARDTTVSLDLKLGKRENTNRQKGKYTIKDWQTEDQCGKAIVSMTPRPIVDKKFRVCECTPCHPPNGAPEAAQPSCGSYIL